MDEIQANGGGTGGADRACGMEINRVPLNKPPVPILIFRP